jgi:hypothetical protein
MSVTLEQARLLARVSAGLGNSNWHMQQSTYVGQRFAVHFYWKLLGLIKDASPLFCRQSLKLSNPSEYESHKDRCSGVSCFCNFSTKQQMLLGESVKSPASGRFG